MRKQSPLIQKSNLLSRKALMLVKELRAERFERSITDQFVRCSTAVGALIAEASDSESKADMRHKFGIALKEARESAYWLHLICEASNRDHGHEKEIFSLLKEVIAMLVSSRKTLSK